MSLTLAAAIVLAATSLAALGGVRVGQRLRERVPEDERAQMYALEASLLGLLALLLGFSFAMASSRYDARKLLVVDEANAIGTARLRASVIADPRAAEIEQLLERYVAVRLQGYRRHDAGLRAAIGESEEIQREAWSRASELARSDPRSLPAALLLQALNEVIDVHGKRLAMGRNHIPTLVLMTLIFVATVTMAWVGACIGLTVPRGGRLALLLAIVISSVVAVIVDLDAPRSGLIRVGQATLTDLQRSFR